MISTNHAVHTVEVGHKPRKKWEAGPGRAECFSLTLNIRSAILQMRAECPALGLGDSAENEFLLLGCSPPGMLTSWDVFS